MGTGRKSASSRGILPNMYVENKLPETHHGERARLFPGKKVCWTPGIAADMLPNSYRRGFLPQRSVGTDFESSGDSQPWRSMTLPEMATRLPCRDQLEMQPYLTEPDAATLQVEHRESIQRLLDSQTFATAPRLHAVLAYLLRTLEEGNSNSLTEQSIGQDVFNKPAGYNASEDNIVRVTVRHLRTRLDEYYSSEGAADPIALVIPKGKYIPTFVPREISAVPATEEVQPAPQPQHSSQTSETETKGPPSKGTARKGRLYRLSWLFAPIFLALGFIVGYQYRSHRVSPPQPTGILADLFRPGSDVSLVTVDANLQAYRQIFGMQVSLDDYIQRAYTKKPLDTTDPRILNAQQFSNGTNETNVSSVIIAASVKEALDGRRIVIKHPHDVSVRDFQDQGNVILLGGPWSDPWGQLFESRFNFRIVPQQNNPSTPEVHNLHPQAGEASIYHPHMEGNLNVNYVRIAIVPNLDKSGHVILLSATSAESLEAAGDYLLSNESKRLLLNRLHISSVAALPPTEFLLEVKGLNSAPESHRILAIRAVQ